MNQTNFRGAGASGIVSTTATVPVLWDQQDTANYLGVSVKKLERDRWAGEGIPYVKVGRAVRYRAADVVAFLDRNLQSVG